DAAQGAELNDGGRCMHWNRRAHGHDRRRPVGDGALHDVPPPPPARRSVVRCRRALVGWLEEVGGGRGDRTSLIGPFAAVCVPDAACTNRWRLTGRRLKGEQCVLAPSLDS